MADVILLDGGMGQELLAMSGAEPEPLWSAAIMMERPELVVAAHRAFVDAGARVITVNSYTVTRPRLERAGKIDRLDELHRTACSLAREAVADSGREVAVAGCLPPLVGSYVADVVPPFEVCLEHYREICALEAPHVDLFICETMSSAAEAAAAARAAAEWLKPVWVAWTLEDDLPLGGRSGGNGGEEAPRLRSGETLAEGAAALEGVPVAARLVNCCRPETVTRAVPALVAMGGPWGAYANGFTSVEALVPGGTVASLEARTDLTPEAYAVHALAWVEAGASIVGGCCEVGPGHIAALAARLEAEGHRIVGPDLAPG